MEQKYTVAVLFKYNRSTLTGSSKCPKYVSSASIMLLTLWKLREIRKLLTPIELGFVPFPPSPHYQVIAYV